MYGNLLFGIVSFVWGSCEEGLPIVATDVSQFYDWIVENSDYMVVPLKMSYFGVKYGHLRSFFGRKTSFQVVLGQTMSS